MSFGADLARRVRPRAARTPAVPMRRAGSLAIGASTFGHRLGLSLLQRDVLSGRDVDQMAVRPPADWLPRTDDVDEPQAVHRPKVAAVVPSGDRKLDALRRMLAANGGSPRPLQVADEPGGSVSRPRPRPVVRRGLPRALRRPNASGPTTTPGGLAERMQPEPVDPATIPQPTMERRPSPAPRTEDRTQRLRRMLESTGRIPPSDDAVESAPAGRSAPAASAPVASPAGGSPARGAVALPRTGREGGAQPDDPAAASPSLSASLPAAPAPLPLATAIRRRGATASAPVASYLSLVPSNPSLATARLTPSRFTPRLPAMATGASVQTSAALALSPDVYPVGPTLRRSPDPAAVPGTMAGVVGRTQPTTGAVVADAVEADAEVAVGRPERVRRARLVRPPVTLPTATHPIVTSRATPPDTPSDSPADRSSIAPPAGAPVVVRRTIVQRVAAGDPRTQAAPTPRVQGVAARFAPAAHRIERTLPDGVADPSAAVAAPRLAAIVAGDRTPASTDAPADSSDPARPSSPVDPSAPSARAMPVMPEVSSASSVPEMSSVPGVSAVPEVPVRRAVERPAPRRTVVPAVRTLPATANRPAARLVAVERIQRAVEATDTSLVAPPPVSRRADHDHDHDHDNDNDTSVGDAAPISPAADPATRFLGELARRPAAAARPLPRHLESLASAIAGDHPVLLRHDPSTAAALQAVGKRAATAGNVIHLQRAPVGRDDLAVLAHELTHVAHPSPEARFFADERGGAEERRADEMAAVIRRAPVLPRPTAAADLVQRAPVIGAHRAGRERRGTFLGSHRGASAPDTISADQLAAQLTAPTADVASPSMPAIPPTKGLTMTPPPVVPLSDQMSAADPGSAVADDSTSLYTNSTNTTSALQEATMGETAKGYLFPYDLRDAVGTRDFVQWLVEQLGDRMIEQLEQRGGRFRGEF